MNECDRMDIRTAGYNAGWEFHMGSGQMAENPYDFGDPSHDIWLGGFVDAGLDS